MQMKSVLSWVAAATLVACGGGGGGGDAPASPVAGSPAAVKIGEANAKPVGAHATATVQDDSAAQGSTSLLPSAVQLSGTGAPVPNLQAMTSLARLGARAAAGSSMAVGVTADQTVACEGNVGTLRVTGSVAGSTGLAAGDNLTLQASGCRVTVDGQAATMNGGLSLSVVSGFVPESGLPPFHVVLAMSTRDLSVQSAGKTATSNGDLRLDWTQSSSSASTIVAGGSALTSGTTGAAGTRSTTLRNYEQSVAVNGTQVTGSLRADVESTSTLLGTAGGSYTVSTPTPLAWTTTSTAPTAGVVKVVGAANSQLQITYSPSGIVLAIDADGDGSFEKSQTVSAADLQGLL